MANPTIDHIIPTPAGPMTRAEAAAHFNIPKNTLIRRIWSNWPQSRWFLPPDKSRKRAIKPTEYCGPQVRHKGRWMTPYGRVSLHKIAEICGVTYHAMQTRLYNMAWPIEDCFNTPMYGRRGKAFILPPDEYARRLKDALAAEYAEQEKADRAARARAVAKRKPK